MPTDAFIKAASAANRQPVVLLAIESPDAIIVRNTSQEQWQASAHTNINTTYNPGEVFLTTDWGEDISGNYIEEPQLCLMEWQPAVQPSYRSEFTTPIFYTAYSTVTGIKCHVLYTGYAGYKPRYYLMGRANGGVWQELATVRLGRTSQIYLDYNGLTSATWDFAVKILTGYTTDDFAFRVESYTVTHDTRYLPTGSVTTAAAALDLLTTPSVASRLEVDDLVPQGCSVTYTAAGRNSSGDSWTSLGAVTETSSLAAYRYYQITAQLSSSPDGLYSPTIKEIRIVGGDSQYTYLSTHKDTPVHGALPYIVPGGISSISSKIDLTQQATVGELTAKLHWRKQTGDMIAGDWIKNKTIICKLGFVGLSEVDYEPYFVGTWYDYQADSEKAIITVKTRNILKRFNKKIPDAGLFVNLDGTKKPDTFYIEYSGNVMQVMLDIADALGIPDRLINRASFTTLAAGARSSADWNVLRKLFEPEDAMELLNELSISSGIFLFEGSDGRLTAKLYDDFAAAAPVDTLDAVHCKFRPVDGGQKDLSTRQAIYYNLLPGKDGGSATDYLNCHLRVNQDSEIAWEETNTREWFDKWDISDVAVQLLAERWHSWFSVPRALVRVDDVPPRYYGIERGAVVAVDNLQLPCPEEEWQGYTVGARFLVMGKSVSDPTSGNLTVSFDLMLIDDDIEFVTDPDFPHYSRLDYWPAVQNLTLSQRIITLPGGSTITMADAVFDQPAGLTSGSCAVWIKLNAGAWQYHGQVVYGGPLAERVYSIDVTGQASIEVALLTINARGITMPLADAPTAGPLTLTGKTSAPATPASFTATPLGTGQVELAWLPIADVDVAGYNIQKGASYQNPITTNAEVITKFAGTRTIYQPTATGSTTFWITAVDTSGNLSTNSASATCTVTALTVGAKYTWIKYSPTSNTGLSDMTDAPDANTIYIGLAFNKDTLTESTTKSDYEWSQWKGTNGVNGTTPVYGVDYVNGTNGDNGKTYTLTITGGVRGFFYNSSGADPTPTTTAFGCTLYEDGSAKTPATYSWTTGGTTTGLISGSGSASTFTPTVASAYDSTKGNNYVTLTVTYSGQTVSATLPISVNKSIPSYITATKITQTTIESPTITAGTFKTAASSTGQRIEILASDNMLHAYNSAGTEVLYIGAPSANGVLNISSAGFPGVYSTATGTGAAVVGINANTAGTGQGVSGIANVTAGYGVAGSSNSSAIGTSGQSSSGYGIYGSSTSNYSGYFTGGIGLYCDRKIYAVVSSDIAIRAENTATSGTTNYAGYFSAQGANIGVFSWTDSGSSIYGKSNSAYGVVGEGGKAPVRLVPSSTTAAPSHSADIGALWATSAGVLYINTSGSTTWTKVGAQ